jgi:glycosyltransferase involved in cell wall biosynthesis
MRILHVFSADFFAGSVAYALALAEAQRREGHTVWLACDAATLPTEATLVQLPISRRSYKQRWRNIRALRQLVQQQQIDVVHAHSRAASWVSYWAVRGLPLPLVSTVHGRQHLHTSTSLFDIYGEKVIAICENLAQHLREEVQMQLGKIQVVPNGVAFAAPAAHNAAPAVPRVAFIGRPCSSTYFQPCCAKLPICAWPSSGVSWSNCPPPTKQP